MKTKLQWRLQEVKDARDVEYLRGRPQKQVEPVQERDYVGCHWKGHRGEATQALLEFISQPYACWVLICLLYATVSWK
jgi:hypothetical protein